MQLSKVFIYEVFFAKVLFNLKAEAARTYLGYVWWILEPALYVLVLYLVFGVLIDRGTEDFVVFLLCGTIPFLWFSKTIANAASSILDGYGLISAMPIPKVFFPMVVVFQDAVKQTFVFVLFLLFLVAYGVSPSPHWLYLIPVIFAQFLLIMSISVLVAAITPFFPDFKFVVPTGTLLLMFGSGLFYSYRVVIPEHHWDTFLLNPMANLINNYRLVLLDGFSPDWAALFFIMLGSLACTGLILIVLNRFDSTYSRLVIQ